MPTDFWSDDDRPAPLTKRRWHWWHIAALVLVVLLAILAVVGFTMSEKIVGRWNKWQLERIRKEILEGELSPEALRDELLERSDGLYIAARLSEDPDPRVRAAAIERLVAKATRAPSVEEAPVDFTGLEAGAEDPLKRLLDDQDSAVRMKAIRAVSAIHVATSFRGELLHILESGTVEERLIVCEYLAHWNGEAVRETFANPRQPREVRLAALRSADRYGWTGVVADERAFVQAMKQVQAEGDLELTQAATDALRHSRGVFP
jgi:HEAT repeats